MRRPFARREVPPPSRPKLSPFAEHIGRAATSDEHIEELEAQFAFKSASVAELNLASVKLEELRARVHNELWARKSRAEARGR